MSRNELSKKIWADLASSSVLYPIKPMSRLTPLVHHLLGISIVLLFENLHIRHFSLLRKVLLQSFFCDMFGKVLYEKTRTHLSVRRKLKFFHADCSILIVPFKAFWRKNTSFKLILSDLAFLSTISMYTMYLRRWKWIQGHPKSFKTRALCFFSSELVGVCRIY